MSLSVRVLSVWLCAAAVGVAARQTPARDAAFVAALTGTSASGGIIRDAENRPLRRARFGYDYDDYAHLARVAEWSSGATADEEA